jgi:hypothetical protein
VSGREATARARLFALTIQLHEVAGAFDDERTLDAEPLHKAAREYAAAYDGVTLALAADERERVALARRHRQRRGRPS